MQGMPQEHRAANCLEATAGQEKENLYLGEKTAHTLQEKHEEAQSA